jgi:uncharacterized protein (DUF2384 family)
MSDARALGVSDAPNIPDRSREAAAAVKALARVFDAWKVGTPEASRLAGVSARTWTRMKTGKWTGSMSDDQRQRASAIIGIYKGLHLYFGDDLADKWVKLPNAGPLFEGGVPVSYMIGGGIPAIIEVRRYIDAIRGGV